MAAESLSSSGPVKDIVAVTASDTTVFAATRGLLVGTAGAATVKTVEGSTATTIPLQAGFNPISVTQVFSTGLTAANIWRLY